LIRPRISREIEITFNRSVFQPEEVLIYDKKLLFMLKNMLSQENTSPNRNYDAYYIRKNLNG